MKSYAMALLLAACSCSFFLNSAVAHEEVRLKELDAYWDEVSRSVREGDFKAYSATCHPLATLVSGKGRKCYPLSEALKRWKVEFDDTKAGTRKSNVVFRFSERLGDATRAHETGIFNYTATKPDGGKVNAFVHMDALLVKEDGKWLIMLEYQKGPATEEEWKALEDAGHQDP